MLHLMASYWVKLALPIGLNAYYVFHPIRSLGDARGWIAILVVVAGAAGVVALVRRAPLYGFAALWVCLFLIPAMNFSGLGRNPFAERYLYLPSAGFCLLVAMTVGYLIQKLPAAARMPVGAAALVAVLAGYVSETIIRNAAWEDDATLFAATLPQSPDAPFVLLMVAAAPGTDLDTAEQDYLKAIELSQQQTPPDRLYAVKGYTGLATLYSERGLLDKALDMLTQARALAPNDPDVAAAEGMILARAGQSGGSEETLTRELSAHPNNENLLAALGLIARDEHHDLKRAAELFSRALAVHPQQDDFNASQHNNLAAVYGDQENYAAAIAELQTAIRILPSDPEFHVNLASALAASGRFGEARAEAEAALRIAPNDPNARDVLERLNQTK
jgi:tetratricopeptide (TPR) repeat protein